VNSAATSTTKARHVRASRGGKKSGAADPVWAMEGCAVRNIRSICRGAGGKISKAGSQQEFVSERKRNCGAPSLIVRSATVTGSDARNAQSDQISSGGPLQPHGLRPRCQGIGDLTSARSS
jgi:hypothetical protein